MLKLQYRGSLRSAWLIGPTMNVGSSKENELVVLGEGISEVHGRLHITDETLAFEPLPRCFTYVNEVRLESRRELHVNDILRIGTREFVVVDPQQQANEAAKSTEEAALPASGWMLQGMHNSLRNKRFPIDGNMIVGRATDCDLHFGFDRLSRKHAELKVLSGVLMLKDLGSSNGTFLNGKKVSQATLHGGDTVAFDKLEFVVIAPVITRKSGEQKWTSSASQTIVQSAVTPDMVRQVNRHVDKREIADQVAAKMLAPEVTNLRANALIVVLVVGVAVLAGVALLL